MPYEVFTLAQIRTQLAQKYESVPFWVAAEETSAVNEALRMWNLLTGMWKRTQTVPTVANQVWYTFSSSFVYNMRVAFNSQPLDPTSIGSLDNGQPNWEGETTATSGVPTRPTVWAPSGLRRLAIWPAHAAGGGSLTIDGVCVTPVLSADGDFIDIAQGELDAVLGEALLILAFKEGGARFEACKKFHNEFIVAAAEQNDRLKAHTFFKKILGLDTYRNERPLGVAAQKGM